MNKVIAKVPIWAYTLILMAVCAVASLFSSMATAELLVSYGFSSTAATVLYVVLIGAAYGGIARLLMRIVYSIGDRLFFRFTRAVPDYNFRRLPVKYNEFVRTVLFWLIIAKLIEALFNTLLTYVYPVGYYLWQFISALVTLACLIAAYFMMDRAYVPTWQSGKCFLALAIPVGIIYAVSVIL